MTYILRRPLRGVGVALALSLALNLFCLAFIGEEVWRRQGHETAILQSEDSGEMPLPRTILRQLIDKLPPEDAERLREGFAARLPELVALRMQSVQAMNRVRADIAQRPFDVEKTRSDMAASREARQKAVVVIQDTFLDILPGLSDAGRSGLAEYRLLSHRN